MKNVESQKAEVYADFISNLMHLQNLNLSDVSGAETFLYYYF